MLDQTLTLPEDPEELRSFTARLLAEVKAQAILIEKLRHQLAGHRAHRFGASSETAEQLQLALETSEMVIPPFLAGCMRRIHAAIFSFWAGVMPPMPMFGRSLL